MNEENRETFWRNMIEKVEIVDETIFKIILQGCKKNMIEIECFDEMTSKQWKTSIDKEFQIQ